MKKKFITVLFFALMFIASGWVYADVFSDNPQHYHNQGMNKDGNMVFIDKNSIRHGKEDLTTYIGILRLNSTSDLFNNAKAFVSATQIPQYIVGYVTIDCIRARLKTGKMVIMGVDIEDEDFHTKILWSDLTAGESEWYNIPNGIEPAAKALLCGPSF